MEVKSRLSALWIVVIANMLFADICSIMVALVNRTTPAIPGDVKMIMSVAVIVTNIPILMIFLSKVLTYKANRLANIIAAFLTIVYIVGGGDLSLHYIIAAAIEVTFLILIIVISWKWRNHKE